MVNVLLIFQHVTKTKKHLFFGVYGQLNLAYPRKETAIRDLEHPSTKVYDLTRKLTKPGAESLCQTLGECSCCFSEGASTTLFLSRKDVIRVAKRKAKTLGFTGTLVIYYDFKYRKSLYLSNDL